MTTTPDIAAALEGLSWSACRGLLATARQQEHRSQRLYSWLGQAMLDVLTGEDVQELRSATWQAWEVRQALLAASAWLTLFAGATEHHWLRRFWSAVCDELLEDLQERGLL